MVDLHGWLVVASAVVLVCILTVNGFIDQHQEQITQARAWAESGPPCPVLSFDAYRQAGWNTDQAFNFIGVGFARKSGNVDCAGVADDGGRGKGLMPACQFNSPEVLRITTPKGQFLFGPRLYRPTTVSVDHGVPRCVLNADFRFVGDYDY